MARNNGTAVATRRPAGRMGSGKTNSKGTTASKGKALKRDYFFGNCKAEGNAGMKDLSNVMSKFLNIGMTIQDVIARTTAIPAKVIQRPQLGNLTVGSEADVAVFRLREGTFGFLDARGQRVDGTRKLEAELTIRAGRVVWDLNGLAASAYRP